MADRTSDILDIRLRSQLIERAVTPRPAARPEDTVARLGALQAQDYYGALWAVALRTPGATAADIETALAERRIVRSWPMRGTLHFVPSKDLRWMLALLTPRVVTRAASREAQLGLTAEVLARAHDLAADALLGGVAFTRAEMMTLFKSGGLATEGQRGYHMLWRLAQEALICLGPMRGKQQTFVLLDEWVPPDGTPFPGRSEGLARLARTYLTSHGPAQVTDFAAWTSITKTDARAAFEAIAEHIECIEHAGVEYWLPRGGAGAASGGRATDASASSPHVRLLPAFDEYMSGYRDRTLQVGEHRETYGSSISANGVFSAIVVIDGRVQGLWKRALKRDDVEVSVWRFRRFTRAETSALADAAEEYGRFLGLGATVVDRTE